MEPNDKNRLTVVEAEIDAIKNRVTGMESKWKKVQKNIPENTADIKVTGKK